MTTEGRRPPLLDVTEIPLQGRLLVEANAGTGKTYQIVNIYLRLLVEREMEPRNILVVTFTRAATEQLLARIRNRIRLLLKTADDQQFRSLTREFVQAGLLEPELIRERLRQAYELLDEAAVFTIHGFCQRLLEEFAFETATAPGRELVQNTDDLLTRALAAFWRERIYPQPLSVLVQMEQDKFNWDNALALLRVPEGSDEVVLPDPVPDLHQRMEAAAETVRQSWRRDQQAVLDFYRKPGPVYKKACTVNPTVSWLKEMEDENNDPVNAVWLPWLDEDYLRECLDKRKKVTIPKLQLFSDVRELRDLFSAVVNELKRELLDRGRELFNRMKQKHRVFSYNDLLGTLKQQLDQDRAGRLAAIVSSRYPVAMVDEFQDTDPVQWSILSRLFSGAEKLLVLIGDPKQAIYRFRNADLFTYLQAVRETDTHYQLSTNYRSTGMMVSAVNRLFGMRKHPFLLPEIAFRDSASAAEGALRLPENESAPLQVWFLYKEGNNEMSQRLGTGQINFSLPDRVTGEIIRLQELSQQGNADIIDARGTERPLRLEDLAILVQSHTQALLHEQSLRRAGISSVRVAQNMIWESDEAREMELILDAIEFPASVSRLRLSMLSRYFGYTQDRLRALLANDTAWTRVVQDFRECHRVWTRSGAGPAMTQLFARRAVWQRLYQLPDRDRVITNTRQLLEWINQAWLEEHRSPWFIRHRLRHNRIHKARDDAWMLQLENDQNAVRIVTMHSSKGLEYPIVFLPWLWKEKKKQNNGFSLVHDRENRNRSTLLLSEKMTDKYQSMISEEDQSEALRLAYVALTRARFRTYLVMTGAYHKQSSPSALDLLFMKPEDAQGDKGQPGEFKSLSPESINARVKALAAADPHLISVKPVDIENITRPAKQVSELPEGDPERLLRPIPFARRVTSFSGMIAGHAQDDEIMDIDLGGLSGHVQAAGDPESQADTEASSIFTFPRGARPGSALHELLEQWDYRPDAAEARAGWLEQVFQKYRIPQHYQSVIEIHLQKIGSQALLTGPPQCTLASLTSENQLTELSFYYPIHDLQTRKLQQVLVAHTLPGLEKAAERLQKLQHSRISGFMHGSIDLVFRWQGRYYLADYKSNYLGDSPEDYTPDRLAEDMLHHHYYLQALIYSVALHRFLRTRLTGYHYETHFGGLFYLYLRGMNPETGGGVYFAKPGVELIEALDGIFNPRAVTS